MFVTSTFDGLSSSDDSECTMPASAVPVLHTNFLTCSRVAFAVFQKQHRIIRMTQWVLQQEIIISSLGASNASTVARDYCAIRQPASTRSTQLSALTGRHVRWLAFRRDSAGVWAEPALQPKTKMHRPSRCSSESRERAHCLCCVPANGNGNVGESAALALALSSELSKAGTLSSAVLRSLCFQHFFLGCLSPPSFSSPSLSSLGPSCQVIVWTA